MTDLSNLPPEVREAIEELDENCSDIEVRHSSGAKKYFLLRDYILRVTVERDALAKRIADAPVARVTLTDYFVQPLKLLPQKLRGQLVALVKVE